jgi:hypothetical protein
MDYKNGKIYKIIDNAYTKMYIGSTTQSLSKRFSMHKSKYIIWKNNNRCSKITVYDIFEEFGIENCKIELIEECLCENRIQLCKKEGEYIKNNNCVNKIIPGRTKQEYNEANKDKILEYTKQWREANNDNIREYNKEYSKANKDKIIEYYQANKDKLKEYRKTNKDKITEYAKKYHEANKDKINAKRRELRAIKKANKEIIIE